MVAPTLCILAVLFGAGADGGARWDLPLRMSRAYVPGSEDLVITNDLNATSRRTGRHAIARQASPCRRSGARATGTTAPSTAASLASR